MTKTSPPSPQSTPLSAYLDDSSDKFNDAPDKFNDAPDKFNDECAVFGVFGLDQAAAHVALGLHALQHRGQEASGIAAYDGKDFRIHRSPGHVGRVFGSKSGVVARLEGSAAIGHNRYSTTGESNVRNIQPLFADFDVGGLAIAHNGNITNALARRRELVGEGAIFQSTSDTEVILHLIAKEKGELSERIINALHQLEGAWSLVCLSRRRMIGVRDPSGFRPLVLGRLGDGWILSSESCGLDILGAEFVREIEPGEMVIIDDQGITTQKPFSKAYSRHFCIFEYIYFARPDSIIDGRSVYDVRQNIGRELAREAPVEADVIVPIPDSGVPGALGYAKESGIAFEFGIIRNHYVGRTFIEPTDEIRHLGVRLKHNANSHILAGKRVILVDDSIVRGTTSRKIVDMVRAAGASEIHLRIASPPTTNGCFYGVDTPDKSDLLASRYTIDEMRDYVKADSLAFLTHDGMYRALGLAGRAANKDKRGFCDACFTGEYPVRLTDWIDNQDQGQDSQISLLKFMADS